MLHIQISYSLLQSSDCAGLGMYFKGCPATLAWLNLAELQGCEVLKIHL